MQTLLICLSVYLYLYAFRIYRGMSALSIRLLYCVPEYAHINSIHTREHNTTQHTSQHSTRQNKTRRDKTKRDETRQHSYLNLCLCGLGLLSRSSSYG